MAHADVIGQDEGMPDTLLTIEDVAERLQTTRQYVHDMIKTRRLTAVNIARPNAERAYWRIREEDLRAFLTAGEQSRA